MILPAGHSRITSKAAAQRAPAERARPGASRRDAPGIASNCPCGGGCPRCAQTAAAPHGSAFAVDALTGPGRPLEPSVRRDLEPQFGADFADVRLHQTPAAGTAARALGARAFTVGHHIAWPGHAPAIESAAGRHLLAHELTHVVQQTRRPRRGDERHHADSEAQARASADAATSRQAMPAIGPAPVGVACSVDDWLNSSPDLNSRSYSELVDDVDQINQWLARQTTSSPESSRLEEALGLLQAEVKRRSGAIARAPKAPKPAKRRKGAKAAAPAPTPAVEEDPPRILRERSSVQYADPDDARREVDRIVAWLQRTDVSRNDRALLKQELANLAPQFEEERAVRATQRRNDTITKALAPSADLTDSRAQILDSVRRIDAIAPLPDRPGYNALIRGSEMIVLADSEVTKLRANVLDSLDQAAARARSMNETTWSLTDDWMKLNYEEHSYVGFAVSLVSGEDPVDLVDHTRNTVGNSNQAVNQFKILRKRPGTSLADQAALVLDAVASADTARVMYEQGVDRATSAAGEIVTGLTITRDLSFAISLSIGAVVAAPVVAAGVGAGGLGLTGAGAVVATGLGTGTVVGTGGAVLRGGSAALGVGLAGGSLDEAENAAWTEGKRGAREGFTTGLGGGVGFSASRALGVGAEGLSRAQTIARTVGANALGNAAGDASNAALSGEGVGGTFKAGGKGALFGGLGSVGGAFGSTLENPAARKAIELGSAAAFSGGLTYAQTGDARQALANAAIATTTTHLISSAAQPTGPTAAEKAAAQFGRDVRNKSQAVLAATMLGTANAAPPVRGTGASLAGLPLIEPNTGASNIGRPAIPAAPTPPPAQNPAAPMQETTTPPATPAAAVAAAPTATPTAPSGLDTRPVLPADVADDFIARLDASETPFTLDASAKRLGQIQSGEKDFVIDRRVTFDIDEPHAVGAKDIKPQRAVDRALDPHNRQLADPHTNRDTKHLNASPDDIARGRERLPPVSVDVDPSAIFTRRFDEVVEMKQVFDEAVAMVRQPGTMSPTELKNTVNRNVRDIIQNGRTAAGIKVRDALRSQGFDFVPGSRLTAIKRP